MTDKTDAKPDFQQINKRSTDHEDARTYRAAGEDLRVSDEYPMTSSRRGRFIIINNVNFLGRTGMNTREGSDRDAISLKMRFKALDFDVVVYKDQSTAQMEKIFGDAAANVDYNRRADCFGCALLSHGDHGIIYGIDGFIEIEKLTEPFNGDKCKELAGKPKIFLIQACRGTKFDSGVEIADSEAVNPGADDIFKNRTFKIPALADFVFAYSTVPGYFSWRNSREGSWFVQAITTVFEKYCDEKDLLWMLTRVNYEVAYKFESKTNQESMRQKKQIPCITSMLTKDLYFRRKY
ncbi:DgyrCDS9086 [Dimorphilus gyrociliatus]|uniref:DgyrCDS9086 n=1 Tax=Dimorphilus gyrociliatus TaxID=2664684 RepID=A0A7I8VW16_9ANNE|nr:DgyrCDS9086 [Dimorphilus gyrociliatus]